MKLSSLHRPSLGLLSAMLLACGPKPGGEPAGTDSTSTSGDEPTSTSGDEPTSTSGEPTPAGCGDGEVEWMHTEMGSGDRGARGLRVAVDGAGRVVVAGGETDAEGFERPLILVLDPAGNEVWRRTITGPAEPEHLWDLAVDDAGQIFVGGLGDVDGAFAGMVRAFTADGEELWRFDVLGAKPEFGAEIGGLALGHGGLYSVGAEFDAAVVRRHDLATGEAVWETRYDESIEIVSTPSVAVVGAEVVVTGQVAFEGGLARPFVLALDDAGQITSVAVEEQGEGWWLYVEAIGGAGERLLAGEHFGEFNGVVVRRARPDGAEVWTRQLDVSPHEAELRDVAVAPDQRIAVVGTKIAEDFTQLVPSVRCLAGDGSDLWEAPFAFGEAEDAEDEANGVAFGPGSLVVVGGARQGIQETLWVRKYLTD